MSDAKGVNTQLNRAPTIGNPTVSRVASSTSELTITATATDEDEGDVLTYKLLRGTSANDASLIELALTPEKIEGRTVTFKDTGLSMDTYYWYKIKVSDGIDDNISGNYGSERTYCLGSFCAGGGYNHPDCPNCNDGQVKCTNSSCNNGKILCTVCGGNGYTSYAKGPACSSCNRRRLDTDTIILMAIIPLGTIATCGRCGQHGCKYTRLYNDEGDMIGSRALCTRCGSVNYSQGRHGNTLCFSCSGHGYLLAMNCYNCSNGQAICTTCGGDRKDEL